MNSVTNLCKTSRARLLSSLWTGTVIAVMALGITSFIQWQDLHELRAENERQDMQAKRAKTRVANLKEKVDSYESRIGDLQNALSILHGQIMRKDYEIKKLEDEKK